MSVNTKLVISITSLPTAIIFFQGAKNITTFEILPPPPPERADDNPWPTWPKVFKQDYGHEEVKLRFGKDPRVFNIMSKVHV